MMDYIENASDRLPKRSKTSVASLLNAIRENRSEGGSAILIREGLEPEHEAVTLAEERFHAFQHLYSVADTWLNANPKAAERAKNELRDQGYEEDDLAVEIGAKLMAGDRIGLDEADAESLRSAYLDAIVKAHGVSVLDKLPTLKDSEERLYGPQNWPR